MTDRPKVSLIMKVYNGEKYIREAIDSILSQTFKDFEFLILDDASTDASAEIINSYNDERIRLIQLKENKGLIYGQNLLIDEAMGEYIAVMDCDDISYPDRFKKQVDYLDKHPEVIMCGSSRKDIIDGRVEENIPCLQLSNESISFLMCFGNYIFTHSSIMFRADLYKKEGFRYGEVDISEDYAIILAMSRKYKVYCIPERLVAYRIYPESQSKIKADRIEKTTNYLRKENMKYIDISKRSKNYLMYFFSRGSADGNFKLFVDSVMELADYYGVDLLNDKNTLILFNGIVMDYLYRVKKLNMKLWKSVRKSPFSYLISLKTKFGLMFLAGCMIKRKRTKGV
ncbi:MAG: glycosyltransferase [Lachnospiraceae bacterium]|nr:glycosyltransferase [Lachnospiraceae bacterium]